MTTQNNEFTDNMRSVKLAKAVTWGGVTHPKGKVITPQGDFLKYLEDNKLTEATKPQEKKPDIRTRTTKKDD
jgi:hypothetical protein